MNNSSPRNIIFDYGATLDTGGCHWGIQIWNAYKDIGVPVGEEAYREAYIYTEKMLGKSEVIGHDFTFRQTLDTKLTLQLEWLANNDNSRFATSFHDLLLDNLYARTVAATAYSREVLQQLKAQGTRMVLISNFYGNLDTVLHEFGFDGLFINAIESATIGIRKPDSRLFRMGVEALGTDATKVTVVGDSMRNDIIPAKSIGCHTVWLKGQSWDGNNTDASSADMTITDIKQLLAI